MQETASFVSGPVRHRPRHSSSAPPNKSFISILKVIHNLKQEERDFNTKPLNKKHMRLIFSTALYNLKGGILLRSLLDIQNVCLPVIVLSTSLSNFVDISTDKKEKEEIWFSY